jgi:release factor glutamine methyltransferase
MIAERRMTVLDVLQVTTAYFKKHDIESSRLNAEHLLAYVLERKRIELYLEFERKLTEAELARLRELVKRRGEGEPLQHLLGMVEFCDHTFLCDRRAMVPRPETEELVEFLKSEIRDPRSEILDVGTGSGVIALSLAAKFPKAVIVAVDVSEDALSLARENATRLNLGDKVQFVRSDLLEDVDGTFNLIVANLPYVSTQDRCNLSREVLRDPEIALFAGVNGDELVRELIGQAPAQLRPGGLLALEIGIGHSKGLLSALAEKKYRDICSKNDYSGAIRFLFARYG